MDEDRQHAAGRGKFGGGPHDLGEELRSFLFIIVQKTDAHVVLNSTATSRLSKHNSLGIHNLQR